MGGFHPTVCPEEAGLHCDVVLMGDAEDTWAAFTLGHDGDTVEHPADLKVCGGE